MNSIKSWISSYLPTQEELENLCFVAVDPRTCKLCMFVSVTSKRLYTIDLSSQLLPLSFGTPNFLFKRYYQHYCTIHNRIYGCSTKQDRSPWTVTWSGIGWTTFQLAWKTSKYSNRAVIIIYSNRAFV